MKRGSLLAAILGLTLLLGGDSTAQPGQPDASPAKSFVYKKTEQGDLQILVHFPRGWKETDRRAGIVFFFGGGWTDGKLSQFEPQATHLADRGMVAARADYRVKSRHGVTPKQCVEDAKSAVRWLRRNAAKLGLDPNRIVAAGGSAGGHLAACTALTPGLDAQGEDLAVSSQPSALVLFNPVLRFTGFAPLMERIGHDEALGKAISPTLHLKKDSPPALLLFGTEDRLLAQGEEFVKRSKELGHRAELFTAEGAGHGFFNREPWLERTTRRMEEFLASLGYLAAGQAPENRPPEAVGAGPSAGSSSPSPPAKPYVPEPRPVRTSILIGAHNCPLWEADQPQMWDQVLKHPERTPALGFYSQENPEVADWETKWAVEHGISFFVYCWYRNGQGGPVKMRFASAIHDALFKSRYVSKMKFAIMWENQARGVAGVSSEADLMENLLPFWMENYFRHPSYLTMDNKPLLFIYRPEFLVKDLGGVGEVRAAFDKMRAACRSAGFDGLYLLGEYRGLDPKHLQLMKQLGLDYTFAYCWHVQGNPSPQQAIAAQLDSIEKTRRLGILPQVVTVSQGWSGWHDEGSIWKIPPAEYKELLQRAKAILRTFPPHELGSRMLLLDNWNEWSEGHYIAPHREYGFGYLDAVREVFSDAPKEHVDLLPKDVGLGPYDQAFQRRKK